MVLQQPQRSLVHPGAAVPQSQRRQHLPGDGGRVARLVVWLQPRGDSMICGLPQHGIAPRDPHSAFTHLYRYPIDGGLVDGPIYGSIWKATHRYYA